MKIEICANGYQSAINAQKSGADRIELCSELAVGGLTPSYGLIKKVKDNLVIPVHILVRPRAGNFTYSKDEFEIMKHDVQMCKQLGCEGIVSGILNDDNTIDIARTKELVELSKPMSFTFHRAFDWVVNPIDELEKLITCGVNCILTSGQEDMAIKGIGLLKKLKEKAANRIEIMPGGGVNIGNILVFKKANFTQIHFSATTLIKFKNNVKVSMNSVRFFSESVMPISDAKEINKMVVLVKS